MTDPSTPSVAAGGTFQLGPKTVHRLGFGAMQITGRGIWGEPKDRANCVAVVRRTAELGINLIDTADSYGPEVSESIIKEALHPYNADLVIATKAGLTRTGPGVWHPVGRPEYLRQQCELSLRRLAVEQIDLFQLHRIDPQVPAADQFGLLRELLDEGKVASVGLSQVSVAEIEAARAIVPIVSVQNLYNLTNNSSDDVLAHCEAAGIGFIPWFPIASGELAQPGGAVDAIVKDTNATPAQVALAWLLQKSPVMLPIPGTRSLDHLDENAAAADLHLTDAQMATLDAAHAAS